MCDGTFARTSQPGRRWALLLALALVGPCAASSSGGVAAAPVGQGVGEGLPEHYRFHVGRDAPVGGSAGLVVALAVGPHDTGYAVDSEASRIIRMDADGRTIGAWGHVGHDAGGFGQECLPTRASSAWWWRYRSKGAPCGVGRSVLIGPMDVAVGPDGDVHVADPLNGRTQRFTPWGTFRSATCVDGPDPTHPSGCVVPTTTPSWSIAVGTDDTVYVALAERAVVRGLAPDGTLRSEWGIEASDVAVSPDGLIWVGEPSQHRVRVLDRTGATSAAYEGLQDCVTFSPSPMGGQAPGIPCNPLAIALDPDGGAFLAEMDEFSAPTIEHVDASGHRTTAQGRDAVSLALALAVDARGTLLVPQSQAEGTDIVAFDAAGVRASTTPILTGDRGDLSTPGDVAWLPDGTFLVLDIRSGQVQRRAVDGRLLAVWGGSGSGEGLLALPRGLTVAPDGTVLIADTENRRIQRFDVDGRFLATIGGADPALGGLVAPMDVVAIDAGGILVADSARPWTTTRIVRYSTAGRFRDAWNVYPTGGDVRVSMTIARSRDGRIAVIDAVHGEVLWLSQDGAVVTARQRTLDANGALRTPTSLAFDNDGSLLVALAEAGIQRFTGSGPGAAVLSAGCGDGVGSGPTGIDIAPDGRLVVAEADNDRVGVFSESRVAIAHIGYGQPEAGVDLVFDGPASVLASGGAVVVGDAGHDRIVWMSDDGAPRRYAITSGCGEHAFRSVVALSEAPEGGVVVGTHDGRLRWLGEDGAVRREWRQPGVLRLPTGVAVLPPGTAGGAARLVVADGLSGALLRFAWDGRFLGATTTGPTGLPLDAPHQLASAPDGTLWVADTNHHRVAHFASDSTPLGSLATGTRGAAPGALDSPEGVAVLPDGTVIVADTGNRRLQAFAPDGTFLAAWSGDGPPGTALRRPSGLSVADDGTLWVADREADRVVVFGAEAAMGWHVQYYRDNALLDGPIAAQWIPGRHLDLDWHGQPPAPGLGATGFSLRAERRAGAALTARPEGGGPSAGQESRAGAGAVLRRFALAVRGGMTFIAPHGQPPVVLARGGTMGTTAVRRTLDGDADWARVDFAATGGAPMVRVVETVDGVVVLPFAGR